MVRRSHRGRGIGRSLLQALCDLARASGRQPPAARRAHRRSGGGALPHARFVRFGEVPAPCAEPRWRRPRRQQLLLSAAASCPITREVVMHDRAELVAPSPAPCALLCRRPSRGFQPAGPGLRQADPGARARGVPPPWLRARAGHLPGGQRRVGAHHRGEWRRARERDRGSRRPRPAAPLLDRAVDSGSAHQPGRAVADPVAWAGAEPAGAVAGIGEPAAVERQAAAADAFGEPAPEALQLGDALIDPRASTCAQGATSHGGSARAPAAASRAPRRSRRGSARSAGRRR